jgi:hypothetical protein
MPAGVSQFRVIISMVLNMKGSEGEQESLHEQKYIIDDASANKTISQMRHFYSEVLSRQCWVCSYTGE